MIEASAFLPWREGEPLALHAAELHLWALPVDTIGEASWVLLDDNERAKAQRIRIESKMIQKAAARAGLRRLLGAYLGCAAQRVRFAYGEHEKPRLAGENLQRLSVYLPQPLERLLPLGEIRVRQVEAQV